MKIVFICGSLKPGNDGVGDYTRRLSGELIRQGNIISIIAFNDKYVSEQSYETQEDENTKIETLRIPSSYPWKKKKYLAKKWLDEKEPDWISLQFVLFSYQKKGLPIRFANRLKRINGGLKWHIMFHELWVGINMNASLKYKLWGKLQQIIIKTLCKQLNPKCVHTQTKLYQNYLTKLGIKARYLPLFSNIPVIENLIASEKTDTAINLVLFGTIHPNVPLKRFAQELSNFQLFQQSKVYVHLIGRCGEEIEQWKNELSKNNIECIIWGEQTTDVISKKLHQSDYGISTTPAPQIEKSGTVAAMLSHGLSVLLISPDWRVNKSLYKMPTNVYDYRNLNFTTFVNQKKTSENNHQLNTVAEKMLNDLQQLNGTQKKIIVSHPTGNEFVREATKGMVRKGILYEFYTAIAVFPGTILDKLGALPMLSDVCRRRFDPILKKLTRNNPWIELARLLSLKLKLYKLTQHEKGLFSVDAVYLNQDKKVARIIQRNKKAELKSVYCYEDGALNTFTQAKKQNLKCFYDLPIGYWRSARKLLGQEKDKWPDWSETLVGFKDSQEKLNRKDQELELADVVFVASSFTAKTLEDYPVDIKNIEIIPYGFPEVGPEKEYNYGDAIKVLFVGGLSQRKGIADLFKVVDDIGQSISLTVVGKKITPYCKVLNENIEKHQWFESLPHAGIINIMREHDILVFPSHFEGFGLVITEAMSQGTPVITTDRTAGPDLIENGKNGWLFKAGEMDVLKSIMENLLNKPEIIKDVGMAARKTAMNRPWTTYGKELAEKVSEYL